MSALTTPSGSRGKGHFNQAGIGNVGWGRRHGKVKE